MKPTGNDEGDIPSEPQDELVAQIVPLRRRGDDTEHREQQQEPQAAAHSTDEWSVFDPPEDLQLAERSRPDGVPQPDDDDALDEIPAGHGASRPHGRPAAFAGIFLTTVAIAAIAVLALKGHAGASEHRRAIAAPVTSLPVASERMVLQQPSRASHESADRRTRITVPEHRRASHQTDSHSDRIPAGSPIAPSHSEIQPIDAQKERSTNSGTEGERGAAAEFGFEH